MSRNPVKSTRRDVSTRVLAVGAGILTLIGTAIGAVLAPVLIEWIAPPIRSATLGQICLETGVRRGDWLNRSGAASQAAKESSRDLDVKGSLASAETTINGYKHGQVTLRGILIDARTGARLPEADDFVQGRVIEPSADQVNRTPLVWFPTPYYPGRFFFRVVIDDNSDEHKPAQRLAVQDGPTFMVKGRQQQVRLDSACVKPSD